jgi:hypothetical protein
LAATVLVVLAGCTTPTDGVVGINQQAAISGGVIPGDAPGFPVTISGAGSYRLTGNLVVADANTTAVEITVERVTLDLNGFSIVGPTVCSGRPLTCSPQNSGFGVTGGSNANTTVRNGSVRGFGWGIQLGPNALIDGIHVSHNRAQGIDAQFSSSVIRSTARNNADIGIRGHQGSILTDNTAEENKTGLVVIATGTVIGNSARNNTHAGIGVGGGSTVINNTATSNGAAGISVGAQCTVIGNTSIGNGADGIRTGGRGSTVIGNTAANNGGHGLKLLSPDGYATNVINDNAAGTVSGGIEMGPNVCDGNSACP